MQNVSNFVTKEQLMRETGVSSETFDKIARRWFSEEVCSVPVFWVNRFKEALLK